MKLLSTPPRRYRPRLDYKGPALYSVGRIDRDRYVTIRMHGDDRHWSLHLTLEEYQEFRNSVDRMLERY